MAEHDFRYNLLNPEHTLIECRALLPGRYQVTGNGGSINSGDTLIVSFKGSRELNMRLQVEKVRHLINPAGQWVAVAQGPSFTELSILTWKLICDQCGKQLDLEFALDSSLGKKAQVPAAEARLNELGWRKRENAHLCPACALQ